MKPDLKAYVDDLKHRQASADAVKRADDAERARQEAGRPTPPPILIPRHAQ